MEPIVGRNSGQVEEDEILILHTELDKEIRGTSLNRTVYFGEQRRRALEVLQMLDRGIESGDFSEFKKRFGRPGSLLPSYVARHYIHTTR